jgi:acetyltransferase-like isoleucine patch superfamily enzyme
MEEDRRIHELRSLGASIGSNVYLGPDVYIERDFAPLLVVEDGAVLSAGVCVLLHDSALNNVAGEPIKFARVALRRRCYVGANTTILCGVEIGEKALVGACSLVTNDIPPETVAYGVPARVRGRVQDLVEKHKQLPKEGSRFHFLDIVPWRERQTIEAAERTTQRINDFIRRVTTEQSAKTESPGHVG